MGNLPAYALDAAHGLHIKFLWRELYGGISGVDTGKLYVFGYGIGDDLTVLCHGIHLHLLGVFHELAYDHRVLLRHICRQLQETFKLVVVGADVHGCT